MNLLKHVELALLRQRECRRVRAESRPTRNAS